MNVDDEVGDELAEKVELRKTGLKAFPLRRRVSIEATIREVSGHNNLHDDARSALRGHDISRDVEADFDERINRHWIAITA